MRQSRLKSSALVKNVDAVSNGPDALLCVKPKFGTGSSMSSGKPPRQMVSDMKWEGDTWISPETLAQNVAKRSRRRKSTSSTPKRSHIELDDDDDADAENELDIDIDVNDAVAAAHRPPRPQDPIDVIHGSSTATATRRRDKDRIPSKQTWMWFDTSASWVLVDRPRVFEAGVFFAYAPIPPKQEDLLRLMLDDTTTSLDDSFLRNGLVPRLNRTHPVSLRLLDWLVVDYAREKDIAYRRYVPTLKREMIVVMHALYTSWLHRWRRRHYDPFRRRHRIYFDLDGETYSTTVAQLHFFYMARLFGFLDYASDHLDEILPHMKATLAGTNEAKNGARRRGEAYRRRPLVSKARPKAFMSAGTFQLRFAIDDTCDNVDADAEASADDDDDNTDTDRDGAGATAVSSTLTTTACVSVSLHTKADAREAESGLRASMCCLFAK